MAKRIILIKKKSDFINIKENGKVYKSNSLMLCKLFDKDLNKSFGIGYKVTKVIGNAVKRNRAKRIMRELVRKNIMKYGNNNFFYVLIAKKAIFDTPFQNLEKEFIELLLKR